MTIDWQARALKAEADAKALLDERDALRNANASTVAKWSLARRAERAEAERDGLAAKLDAVKAYRDAVRGTQAGRDLELILADTNEGSGINA